MTHDNQWLDWESNEAILAWSRIRPSAKSNRTQIATLLATGRQGSFAQAIGSCLLHADESNLRRLAVAFPEIINIAHELSQ